MYGGHTDAPQVQRVDGLQLHSLLKETSLHVNKPGLQITQCLSRVVLKQCYVECDFLFKVSADYCQIITHITLSSVRAGYRDHFLWFCSQPITSRIFNSMRCVIDPLLQRLQPRQSVVWWSREYIKLLYLRVQVLVLLIFLNDTQPYLLSWVVIKKWDQNREWSVSITLNIF